MQPGDADQRKKRRNNFRALAAAAVVAIVGFTAWLQLTETRASAKFCTVEALVGIDGELYGRSIEHDCAFVDDDGNPIELDDPMRFGDPMLFELETAYTRVLNAEARDTFGGLAVVRDEVVIWSTDTPASVEALLESHGLDVPADKVTIRQGEYSYDDLMELAGAIDAADREGRLAGVDVKSSQPDVQRNGVLVFTSQSATIEALRLAMPSPELAAAITAVEWSPSPG